MNNFYYIFYQSAMIVSLLVSIFLVVLLSQRHQFPGARAMIALAGATAVWTFGFLMEANSSTLERQLFFNDIGYIGSMTVPVTWFLFALQYSIGGRLVTKRLVALLLIIPAATLALVWSNTWHHLMWYNEHLTTSGPFLVTAKVYGTFFWASLIFNYLLIVVGAIILMRRLFVGTPLHKGQAVSLIIAIGLPLVWNVIYVFNLTQLPRKDLTPLMFALSGTAIILGLVRFRLLKTVPFAYNFVIQQISDGVIIFDSGDFLLDINPAALKTTALDKSIIGKSIKELASLSSVFEQILSAGFGRVGMQLNVSGNDLFFELEKMPLRDRNQRQVGWLAILRDVTERKKMQEQLIMQDRLVSIGQLTSGIAHELNNPLTSVIGFSELLLQQELPDSIKEDLKIIDEEARRTARIVKNLLTFAGKQQPQEKQPININDIILRVLELRAYEHKLSNIQVNTRLGSDLPQITGDSSQLQQVFFNIIINGEFFMFEAHRKGTLTIITDKTGNSVRASISDDGPGIPPENMSKIFSPFFTTKQVGKGTGLGLSVCHGIIMSHSGRIWAESNPGQGATFFIELPIQPAQNLPAV